MNESPDSGDEPLIQTVAEPVQELLKRQAALEDEGKPKAAPAHADGFEPPKKPRTQSPKTVLFRPTGRQPLALLTILDDGHREQGERIRIRDSRVTIGREKGFVTVPFDVDISSQHVELRCQKVQGKSRWYLIDLNSTNGTFLRAYRARLSQETDLICGSRRYRFQLPGDREQVDETKALETQAYQAPRRTMMQQFVPRLTEIGLDDNLDSASFMIGASNTRLGRSQSCEISVTDDPFLSPQHARFIQDERGRWTIEDTNSLNGVWIRIKRMPLDQQAEFQIGQQRFRFQPHAMARK